MEPVIPTYSACNVHTMLQTSPPHQRRRCTALNRAVVLIYRCQRAIQSLFCAQRVFYSKACMNARKCSDVIGKLVNSNVG